MRYRNIKTGIEFKSSCIISGADFEQIGAKPVEQKPAPKKVEAKTDEKPVKTATKRSKK